MLNRKIIPRFGRWLVIGLCLCLLSLGIGLAQAAPPFYWDFINVDIVLESNGDMVVTEIQKYTFTADHTNQRYRYIPLNRVDQITDIAVYEGEEQLSIQSGIEDNQHWIRWRHNLDAPASHTFKVQYRVIGGIQARGKTSQIYWRALFSERNADIKQGKVTVHLPKELVGKVNYFTSRGAPATNRQVGLNTLEFVVARSLAQDQFLDVIVRFPTGLLDLRDAQSTLANSNENEATTTSSEKNSPLLTNDSDFPEFLLSIVGLIISRIFYGLGLYLLGLFLVLGLAKIVEEINGSIEKRPCPNCGKRGVQRKSWVTRAATTECKGEREVGHVCSFCDYRRTYREDIPKKSTSSSSSHGGYYGGGFGGGGGGFGGGGGGCGGGGGFGGGGGGG